MNISHEARQLLATMADDDTNRVATYLVQIDRAAWQLDPEHDDVLALVDRHDSSHAFILIFKPSPENPLGDFEIHEDIEAMVYDPSIVAPSTSPARQPRW